MIRIVVENLFFFLLPSLLYIAWIAYSKMEWAGLATVIREAPLVRLFVAGAALMLAVLVSVSSRSQYGPHDVYIPPAVDHGKLEPGHGVAEESTTEPAKR